jgi:hypothetical protein
MRSVFVALVCLTSSTVAFADTSAEPDPAAGSAPAAAPAPLASPSSSGLRNGFSLAAGIESGGDRDVSATMFGIDWRIGWRINEPISVYLHSHLSFGSAKEGNGAAGATGTFATALMGEYKLPMRVFVAGGGGYGVLNNPSGPLAAARVGYYPFKTQGAGKKRRLNISLDYRAFFANQGYGTVSLVALSLGYDRF